MTTRRAVLALAAVGAAVAVAARRRRRPVTPAVAPAGLVHRAGSGTPLVLLHGVGGTWRVWQPVLAHLQAQHDVIAPTLLGHGGGAPLAKGVAPSIQALTDGVVAELDQLGLERVHVVGNSLGGWIALELARRGRARSVVVFGPAGAWRSVARMTALATGMRLSFALLGSLAGHADAIAGRRWLRRVLLASQVEHPDRLDPVGFAADIRAVRESPVVAPLLRTLITAPLEPLPEPGCPVRVVWSERDRVIPFAHYGAPLLERVPTAELVRLPGAGHVPMSDAPDEVARLVLDVTRAVDTANPLRRAAQEAER